MTCTPGIKASHQLITDTDRSLTSDAEAMKRACDKLRESLVKNMGAWRVGRGTKFHLVLTIEAEEKE